METAILKQQRLFLDDEPEKTLVFAIIAQAINDYRNLKLNNLTKKRDGKGTCTNQEIEKFFNGNWCQELLDGLNIKITGKDILYKLKGESIDFTKICINSHKCT